MKSGDFLYDLTRESEPARNDAAPALNFKCGSGSSHFKDKKNILTAIFTKQNIQKHIRLL